MTLIRPFLAVLLFAALGLLPGSVLAQPCDPQFRASGQQCNDQLNTITTAVPFLLISPDSRAGGMGDAGVAISPDANAIHWNPAKLAFAENDGEFSMSYSPWLRNLVPDMSLAYLAGYKRLSNKRSAIGGSLRYFNLGSILFTDVNGSTIRDFKPAEFAVDMAFSQKFSDRFSGGIAIRYVNSNLTGGISVQGANSKAGQSVAADVSFFYMNDQAQLGDKDATFAFGVNVSNIGAKMSYTETAAQNFIPINLRLGPSLKLDLDQYNSIAFNLDVNKLLVPTPPVYLLDENGALTIDPVTGNYQVASGRDPDVGVMNGIWAPSPTRRAMWPTMIMGSRMWRVGAKCARSFGRSTWPVGWSTGMPSSSLSAPATSGSITPKGTASTSPWAPGSSTASSPSI